jgi:hypothetical protein
MCSLTNIVNGAILSLARVACLPSLAQLLDALLPPSAGALRNLAMADSAAAMPAAALQAGTHLSALECVVLSECSTECVHAALPQLTLDAPMLRSLLLLNNGLSSLPPGVNLSRELPRKECPCRVPCLAVTPAAS